jgi:hypothetical protein
MPPSVAPAAGRRALPISKTEEADATNPAQERLLSSLRHGKEDAVETIRPMRLWRAGAAGKGGERDRYFLLINHALSREVSALSTGASGPGLGSCASSSP